MLLVLGLVVALFIIAPPVVVYFEDVTRDEALLVLGIIYLAYSPLIILLARTLKKSIAMRIICSGEGITCRAGSEETVIFWEKLDRFVFDYVASGDKRFGISRYFVLYEFGSVEKRFRFNRLMTKKEIEAAADIHHVSAFKKKAYAFEAYGLYFRKKICDRLVYDISSYSSRVPERDKGFF